MSLNTRADSQGQLAGPPGRDVLVVDDSRMQRHILATSLRNWGYRVREAAGGAEALELCRAAPPDLILSDWMMPGMDGLAFCRAFRALALEQYGYFILLTSKQEKDQVARGLDNGADDFLTKPVNSGELRARISAGERLLRMQEELREKNRLIKSTLDELQALYDSLDSDLVEARKLQLSLVRERFHDFGPAQVALMLRPAGRVGGDLVGFFPVDGRKVGLFALDVSGHGISSALMTARLAGYLSTATPDQNVALAPAPGGGYCPRPPDEVAARLNRLMLEEMETEHYVTLLLAFADMTTGRVHMVQAGHPHPLVQRRSGRVETVGQGGLPVGLLAGARYESVEVRLQPGDRLVIPSDGITECPDAAGRLLGEAGLARMLRGLRGLGGTAVLESLLWMLGEHNVQRDFPDDVSAVLLDYTG
ncbi:PP2C family protein-serine/threonine phosphatase [Maritimibacter alkaliphilus]|uniref:PP2C family protein-serine/threonine phosphatase n=1 Tax=Maritimibacter alkaliphilus TaxID=404236 RepID=UPI0028F72E57|nr:SpoIIE family protein phosphatase [Maritimibacter alkaliphilus]